MNPFKVGQMVRPKTGEELERDGWKADSLGYVHPKYPTVMSWRASLRPAPGPANQSLRFHPLPPPPPLPVPRIEPAESDATTYTI